MSSKNSAKSFFTKIFPYNIFYKFYGSESMIHSEILCIMY